eukprot:8862201-Lingulodinium_polyedra.AAC.1
MNTRQTTEHTATSKAITCNPGYRLPVAHKKCVGKLQTRRNWAASRHAWTLLADDTNRGFAK